MDKQHPMGYFSVLKINEILIHAIRINLENIVLRKNKSDTKGKYV